MTTIIRLIPIALASFFLGCDAISSTDIVLQRSSSQSEPSVDTITTAISIVTETANLYGFKEVARGETDVSFTNLVAGSNPNLWIALNCEALPMRIEIREMYIDHRTEKHKQLVNALLQKLTAQGYAAKVESHSSDFSQSAILLGVTTPVVLATIMYWQVSRIRRARIRNRS